MWFESTYTMLGGLGLLFFGIKTLSEALQAAAGNYIRRVIQALTTNRLMAVAVGTLVTTLIQSSSITTVMVVGVVNAGLMELTQAIGVIIGANIGTTITGWIIAIKIGKYGLLLVGAGTFPMLFAKRSAWKQVGSVLIALGFVFLGLQFMSSAFKPLRDSENFLQMMQYFSADTYPSLLACIGVGAIVTCLIQSSSAVLGVTIALAISGAIPFQSAAALVLGENIGTTITALLASIGTNTNAKRAARAHATFNTVGVLWISSIFWWYLGVVDWVIPGDPTELDADGSPIYVAAHIAAAHSIFNVANTLLFIPFVKQLARFVRWITPQPPRTEIPHLKYLPAYHGPIAPSIGLVAAQKELLNLADLAWRVFEETRTYLAQDTLDEEMRARIRKREDITDAIQTEITLFICRLQESKITRAESQLAYSLIRAADEIESIADYCENLAHFRDRLASRGESFGDQAKAELLDVVDRTKAYFEDVLQKMQAGGSWNLRKFRRHSDDLIARIEAARRSHRRRVEAAKIPAVAGMLYSDMLSDIRRIRGHTMNVAETIAESSPPAVVVK